LEAIVPEGVATEHNPVGMFVAQPSLNYR